jgi:hypothetical protein
MNLNKSNLYKLFLSLTDNELKELDKAVRSIFFNYREEEIKLFEYLLKTKKSNDEKLLDATVVFKHVFPKQKTDLAKLRHVMTYLMRIMKRFLVINEIEQHEVQKKLLLGHSFRKRNLEKLFLSEYEEATNHIQHRAPLSLELYFYQLQLHTEYYAHSITNKRAKNEDLQILSDDLDSFYIIQKLKQICNILSYKNIFKTNHQPQLTAEVLSLMKQKNMLSNPLVNLLYCNYNCLNEPDNETHFIQLKKSLLANAGKIETKELKDIFTLAINYCIKRLNTGGQKYFQEVFEIYKAGLAISVFEEAGYLSPFTYKNIAAIAIGLKEYNWAETFIENHKALLHKEYREGFYAYCLARCCFAKNDYNKVIDLLQEVEIKEQFTDLDARVLLSKTYYELDEFNLIEYCISNLKQQLKRKKLQTYHETVYKNFARMISRLIHLRQYDKKAKQLFKEELNNMNAVAEKSWLLSKV